MIEGTGIRVSEEDRLVAHERARDVSRAPVAKVHGRWLHEDAAQSFGDWIDALAKRYGLPEPAKDSDGDPIHYGMANDGEFTRWVGEADDCPPQSIMPVKR